VEIAAPLPPYIGTNKELPTILVKHAPAAIHICILLFFLKAIPPTVVSETVNIIGLNIRNGNIKAASRYLDPNSMIRVSLVFFYDMKIEFAP
jgi:hypothetical protein